METLRTCRAATLPLVLPAQTLHILLLCVAVFHAGALAQEAAAGDTSSTIRKYSISAYDAGGDENRDV